MLDILISMSVVGYQCKYESGEDNNSRKYSTELVNYRIFVGGKIIKSLFYSASQIQIVNSCFGKSLTLFTLSLV